MNIPPYILKIVDIAKCRKFIFIVPDTLDRSRFQFGIILSNVESFIKPILKSLPHLFIIDFNVRYFLYDFVYLNVFDKINNI